MTKKTTAAAKTEAVTETKTLDQLFVLDDMLKTYKTKSALIRFLTAEGHTRSAIAKFMNIRYQHVRNVQMQPLKKPVTAK